MSVTNHEQAQKWWTAHWTAHAAGDKKSDHVTIDSLASLLDEVQAAEREPLRQKVRDLQNTIDALESKDDHQDRRIAALEAALREIRGGLVALSEHCTSRNAVIAPEIGAAAYVVPCDKMEAWLAPLYEERNAHVLRDPTAALDRFGERCVAAGIDYANKRTGKIVACFEPDAAAIVQRVKEEG